MVFLLIQILWGFGGEAPEAGAGRYRPRIILSPAISILNRPR